MAIIELERITESKLILAEGHEDKNFLIALLVHLNLIGIQVISCKSKDRIPDNIETVSAMPDFKNKVISLGIVRDSDDSQSNAFDSIRSALARVGLSAPTAPLEVSGTAPKIIVMLWPCGRAQGELEDSCLQSVASSKEMICVDKYFDCLNKQHIKMPRKLSKAKVQTYLASQYETYPHLGVAAARGCWPWNDKTFDDAKHFLNLL